MAEYSKGNDKLYRELMGMQWKIHGKSFRFGSKPVDVKIDATIDTILYKIRAESQWAVIICSISEPRTYKFEWNSCCDGFDISSNSDWNIPHVGVFSVASKPPGKSYLASISSSSMLIRGEEKTTVRSACNSPMHNSLAYVTIQDVMVCKDSTGCESVYCFFSDAKQEEADPDFYYRENGKVVEFLYVQLTQKPIQISYDVKKRKLVLK